MLAAYATHKGKSLFIQNRNRAFEDLSHESLKVPFFDGAAAVVDVK